MTWGGTRVGQTERQGAKKGQSRVHSWLASALAWPCPGPDQCSLSCLPVKFLPGSVLAEGSPSCVHGRVRSSERSSWGQTTGRRAPVSLGQRLERVRVCQRACEHQQRSSQASCQVGEAIWEPRMSPMGKPWEGWQLGTRGVPGSRWRDCEAWGVSWNEILSWFQLG